MSKRRLFLTLILASIGMVPLLEIEDFDSENDITEQVNPLLIFCRYCKNRSSIYRACSSQEEDGFCGIGRRMPRLGWFGRLRFRLGLLVGPGQYQDGVLTPFVKNRPIRAKSLKEFVASLLLCSQGIPKDLEVTVQMARNLEKDGSIWSSVFDDDFGNYQSSFWLIISAEFPDGRKIVYKEFLSREGAWIGQDSAVVDRLALEVKSAIYNQFLLAQKMAEKLEHDMGGVLKDRKVAIRDDLGKPLTGYDLSYYDYIAKELGLKQYELGDSIVLYSSDDKLPQVPEGMYWRRVLAETENLVFKLRPLFEKPEA